MNKSISELTAEVRKHMDEIAVNAGEFADLTNDNSDMEVIITSKVCQAIDDIRSAVNISALDSSDLTIMDDGFVVDDNKTNDRCYAVSEPTDMLRFVKGSLSSWLDDVYTAYISGSQEAKIAYNEYVGASVYRPAVVRDKGTNGNIVVFVGRSEDEYARENETATIWYVPKATINNNNITFGDKLETAIVLYLTALVLIAYGESDRASVLNEQVKNIINYI